MRAEKLGSVRYVGSFSKLQSYPKDCESLKTHSNDTLLGSLNRKIKPELTLSS